MFRRQPLNYLATLVLAGALWFCAAIPIGNYLRENITVNEVTPDEVVEIYQVILTSAGVLALLCCYGWYFYGSRREVAAEIPRARRIWISSFLLLVATAFVGVGAVAVLFLGESFTIVEYLIVFGVMSLVTYALYWTSTFFLSPPTVEFVPWGK